MPEPDPVADTSGQGTNARPLLVVVTPCYDEEDVVERFHEELVGVLETVEGLDFQLLFVDDGSTDDTLGKLNGLRERDPRVRVVSLSRNFGHQVALTAGLTRARGDAVCVMDSDLQHPPAVVPRLVAAWRAGNDVVSAVRNRTADGSLLKDACSRAFYWLIGKLSDTPIEPGAADFYLLSRRAQEALLAMPERHRFLRGMVAWIGYPRAFVRYDAPARAAGRSKYDLRRMVALGLDAVFSFSVTPIRVMSRLGLALTGLGLVYLAYIFVRAFTVGDLQPGWGSVLSTILVLGGLQLVFMGVIGEYLARVYEEVKGRPLFLLRQDAGGAPAEGAGARGAASRASSGDGPAE